MTKSRASSYKKKLALYYSRGPGGKKERYFEAHLERNRGSRDQETFVQLTNQTALNLVGRPLNG